MPNISFCPQTRVKLDALLGKGLFAGYGLVIFPHETTGALRAEFISLPVIVALKAKLIQEVLPNLSVYAFGMDPLPDTTDLYLAFEVARPHPEQDMPEVAVGFPMTVALIPKDNQNAQAS